MASSRELRHKRGERVGVYSLCSAHPLVVECALREAQAFDAPLLVGNAAKARRELGFVPSLDLAGLARHMVEADLARERNG